MKKYFSRSVLKEWKQDGTPVTKADIEINKLVIKRIKEVFPEHDILGEEESSMIMGSEYVWVCDPIDGTRPFSHGISCSVFSLALVKDGSPIVGVIYDPWMDRLYYAEKNKGCLLNNELVMVNNNKEFKRCVMGYCIWRNPPFDLIDLQQHLRERDVRLLDVGSVVYEGMLVASGEFTAAFYAGNACHDVAALKTIVEEAGGKVTDLFGNEQKYHVPVKGIIASNGLLHDELVGVVSGILAKKPI